MTPEQQAVIDSDAPLILCTAVAGAGKTSTLIARTLRLVRDGTDPKRIALVTYTNRAAQNMRERLVCPECDPSGDGPAAGCRSCHGTGTLPCFVGTLHSFCLLLLRQDHALIGYGSEITVLSEDDAKDILDETIQEHRYRSTVTKLDAALAAGPYQKDTSGAGLVAKAYWVKLREMGAMDYDGILLHALQSIRLGGEAAKQFLAIAIDECQDASSIDMEIYRALPIPTKLWVGDVAQGIYQFRGGDIEQIKQLAADPSVTKLPLSGNFRCASEICRVATKLIPSPMRSMRCCPECWQHGFIASPNPPFERLRCDACHGTGTVRGTVLCPPPFENESDEIRFIAQAIQKNCVVAEDFDTCAILLRYNVLVEQYARGLESYSIPVCRSKAPEERPGWQLAKRLISFMSNPNSDRGILCYIEALSGKDAALCAKKKATEMLCSVNEAVLMYPGPIPVANAPSLLQECGVNLETCEAVHDIAATLPPGYSHSDLLLALNEQDVTAPSGSGVKVLTCHSAKGLEFSTVFVSAFEQAIYPGTDTSGEIKRLAYVAITRASDQLVLTHCKSRRNGFTHQIEQQQPSPYIELMGL